VHCSHIHNMRKDNFQTVFKHQSNSTFLYCVEIVSGKGDVFECHVADGNCG
jgi:hypothetical protein